MTIDHRWQKLVEKKYHGYWRKSLHLDCWKDVTKVCYICMSRVFQQYLHVTFLSLQNIFLSQIKSRRRYSLCRECRNRREGTQLRAATRKQLVTTEHWKHFLFMSSFLFTTPRQTRTWPRCILWRFLFKILDWISNLFFLCKRKRGVQKRYLLLTKAECMWKQGII